MPSLFYLLTLFLAEYLKLVQHAHQRKEFSLLFHPSWMILIYHHLILSCWILQQTGQTKLLLLMKEHLAFFVECDRLPLTLFYSVGNPCKPSANHSQPSHSVNNFCLRLLVGCDGLEQDASCFRQRRNPLFSSHDASCKLCHLEPETPAHFIAWCPISCKGTVDLFINTLSCRRRAFDSGGLQGCGCVNLTLRCSVRIQTVSWRWYILGLEWHNDQAFQHHLPVLLNLHQLRHHSHFFRLISYIYSFFVRHY